MNEEQPLVDAVRIVFEGRVQGVGFRYTAARLAEEFQIRGWVRNAFDGSVEMVAAAPEERLNLFLEQLQSHMRQNILSMHKETAVLNSDTNGFEIRR